MNITSIKRMILPLAVAFAATAGAATIDHVCVRQMWPWNEKVRIDYTLSGTAGESVDVAVTIRDAQGGTLAPLGSSFSGDLNEVAPGEHVIWWNPAASGLEIGNTQLTFTLAAEVDSQRYCVIDISQENAYSVSYLAAKPAGGWTDEYKTTKIVFRHVKPGTFVMGTPEDENGRCTESSGNIVFDMAQHKVTITKDYWLGIFPITLKQATIVNGSEYGKTSTYAANQKDASPAVKLSATDLMGWPDNSNTSWFASPVPLEGSWLYKLNAGITAGQIPDGTHFSLPTDAQWEYACRAGTTTAYGNGTDSIAGIGPATPATKPMYPVGGYSPNAWGFYDMHSCVWQWTIEIYSGYSKGNTAAATDPYYAPSLSAYWLALRGGTYSTASSPSRDNRSGTRYYRTNTVIESYLGARIALVKAP